MDREKTLTDSSPEDTIVITVKLRHRSPWKDGGESVTLQQAGYNYRYPDFDEQDNYSELVADVLEKKARLVIDQLLEWRKENHQHNDSDPNPAA